MALRMQLQRAAGSFWLRARGAGRSWCWGAMVLSSAPQPAGAQQDGAIIHHQEQQHEGSRMSTRGTEPGALQINVHGGCMALFVLGADAELWVDLV